MSSNVSARQLRSFGFIVGGIFIFISLWPLTKGNELRLWAMAVGFPLVCLGLIWPSFLKYPYLIWGQIGGALGFINLRIILVTTFALLFTPISILRKFLGKDSIGYRLDPGAETYAHVSKKRDSSHFKRQF